MRTEDLSDLLGIGLGNSKPSLTIPYVELLTE
jgi:hypothetical protein